MTKDTTALVATRRFDVNRLPLRAPAPPTAAQQLLAIIRSVRKSLDGILPQSVL